ncbi:circadian clock-controlled protein daywake-like [Pararge aegeria]|uniref:Jg8905 protein n=1 Tax=Pararge aegeria aegeria TaxID=348720 RepID=A0A8S4SDX7_9NEOP|nr:circadian clock-controlled protein daywake-like [Pararge aegeria]CAH2266844.1 jg8905 [Pararge aegeria aegeria]
MFHKYTFLLFALYCLCSDGVLSNSLLAPCKIEDAACIQKSVQAAAPKIITGIPELGIESSDPLFLERIEGDLSILKYKFFNTTITGYKDCQISNIIISPDLTNVHFELNCPTLKMSGLYDINGRLIILPVEGNGDFFLTTGKYNILVDSELKIQPGTDGKSHLSIKNFKLKCTAKSPIIFDFRNLFNGQKDLSDAVHKFANESWDEVSKLVQDPVFYACMNKIIKHVNKYLKTVPLEDFKLN